MSEQSDQLKKLAREKGVPLTGPAPALPGMEEKAGRPDLPMVRLPRDGRQVWHFAKEIGAIVGANGLFRRENVPVTIDPETGRIEDMDVHRFRTYVETQCVCFVAQFSKKGYSELPATMMTEEARGCLASDIFRFQQRKIQRVNFVRLPVVRADGRIELLPKGYDAESEIYTMENALEYDTKWDLERAKLFLDDLLSEFPFTDARSKAVHITAMLAMFGTTLQLMQAKRLNFVYRANQSRAGKSLLAQTAVVPVCGPASIQGIPESKEEFKKILDTEALNGSSYIFFDDIARKLVNPTLNSFLTANVWTGRLMNTQKKFTVPQNAIVFMTGNNLELSQDLAGRCLMVDLYVGEADVQARKINRVMDELYLAKLDVRRDCLSALWALVKAWDSAKPDARPSSSSVVVGFQTFSNIFGGIVEHAGYGDPMAIDVADVAPDYGDMLAIVERVAEGVTDRREFEFNELISVCRELHAFEWHLEGKVGKKKIVHTEKDEEGKVVGVEEVETETFELTAANKSWFGKLFSMQYGGTIFTLAEGRRARFGKRGKNRKRRYIIEMLTET